MNDELSTTLHPDDADLVRLMDRELSGAERATVESHLGGCAACVRRRATLARRAARTAELIRLLDIPAPATPLRVTLAHRAPSPQWWRVAAVVALAVAAAAVPPVRAWIVDAARAVWSVATGSTAPEPGAGPRATGGVAFVPSGPVLTIRTSAQSGATITVEVVDSARVTMVESAGRPLPRVTVLPDELRVEAGADSTASYLVRVPITLEAVRILVEGKTPQVFRPSVGERRTFPLR